MMTLADFHIEYLTKEQVAIMIQKSTKSVERAMNRGDLPYSKDGKAVRFSVADVRKYMDLFKSKNSY
jgi:hypothetical protein